MPTDPSTAAFLTQLRIVPVLAVANRDVIEVTPDAPIAEVRVAMSRSATGCVVVMNEERAPLGIVTAVDLLEHAQSLTAAEVMTADVVTVRGMAPITRAAALMAYEGVHHLPVVDDAGEVIAILSSLDVLRHLAKEGGFIISNVTTRAA